MDIRFEMLGTTFIWDEKKAQSNRIKHDGITFEQAATNQERRDHEHF